MAKIDQLLETYGESHQNATNKLIHWFAIPAIMFSLFGLLYSIPFPGGKTLLANWAFVFFLLTLIYYVNLSIAMTIGFILVGFALVLGNHTLAQALADGPLNMWQASLIIFAVAWIIQFIGHKIEGKKPSFFEDVQYLMIGPAWLMHFIFSKVGIKY